MFNPFVNPIDFAPASRCGVHCKSKGGEIRRRRCWCRVPWREDELAAKNAKKIIGS